MRIGISGSHATGKSTLVAELSARLPEYAVVDEAYTDLVVEGHMFGAKPTLEDFEAQLVHSVGLVETSSQASIIFDRGPVDYLAYLIALGADTDTLGHWSAQVRAAMPLLDGVVFVPVEERDRISVSSEDLPRLRRAVDRALRELLVEDSWGFSVPVHECYGSPSERAIQVLRWMKPSPPLRA